MAAQIQKPETNESATVKKVAEEKENPINVIATQKGYYNDNRVAEGQKFTIKSMKDFSERWMETV